MEVIHLKMKRKIKNKLNRNTLISSVFYGFIIAILGLILNAFLTVNDILLALELYGYPAEILIWGRIAQWFGAVMAVFQMGLIFREFLKINKIKLWN